MYAIRYILPKKMSFVQYCFIKFARYEEKYFPQTVAITDAQPFLSQILIILKLFSR